MSHQISPNPCANSYQCQCILIARLFFQMDQKHSRDGLTVHQTIPSPSWACDCISWHPLHLAVTMWWSSSQCDMTGNDVRPSEPSPYNFPTHYAMLLPFCPSLMKISPATLEATWTMAEPQEGRYPCPWSLLGREPTAPQVSCSKLYMSEKCFYPIWAIL